MGELSRSPFKHPFHGPSSSSGLTPRCKQEWLIIDISNSIRLKGDWWIHYKDEGIRAAWTQDLSDAYHTMSKYRGDPDYTDELFAEVINFVFQELEFYESLKIDTKDTFQAVLDERIFCSIRDFRGSNYIISSDLKGKLREKIHILLEKDDTASPTNSERHLVHPSLYPLQYGRTPILDDTNQIKLVGFNKEHIIHKKDVEEFGISKQYQWIPSIFKIKSKYDSATGISEYNTIIASYINNLHPIQHEELYPLLAELFNCFIPGLNMVLTRFASPEYRRIKIEYATAYDYRFIDEYESMSINYKDESSIKARDLKWSARADHLNKLNIRYSDFLHNRNLTKIDVSKFENLKVITKLSNIELTPEQPYYNGGSWHVEGTTNEDIVATVIYYYDIENITDSKVSVRSTYNIPEYENNDLIFLKKIYGLENNDTLNHKLGSYSIQENDIIILPNIFQHFVEPFQLQDKTKPGYIKYITFYIVDPYNDSITSTDKVPPQQEAWWEDSIRNNHDLDGLLTKEIMTKIKECCSKHKDHPIASSEANLMKDELIKERILNFSNDDRLHGNPFNVNFTI